MPSVIDEHHQFTDSSGQPIVNGSIYIGSQNQDPVANPITIYSDRGLTTNITNPQTTDANGRATNKIWVPGKYSIRVDNSDDVQQYQELDAGELSQTGITPLVNVQGTNTITAEASPSIVSLEDNQQYNFRAANANTGAVTLQIDLTSAKSIKKQHDVDLESGDIEQDQTVSVVYNATDDTFELVSNAATTSFADLAVTNEFTYGGVVQPSTPAQESNHIRAGNTQILDGSAAGGKATFQVSTSVTQATWESVGPTGSGADDIWTALDDLPASATILLVDAALSGTTVNDAHIQVYVVHGDEATPAADVPDNLLVDWGPGTLAGSSSPISTPRLMIPLGATNQDFHIYWDGDFDTSETIQLRYRGFMTD